MSDLRIPAAAAAVLLMLSTAGANAALPRSCTFGHARYATPEMTLSVVNIGRHQDMVSDVALHILDRKTGKTIAWYYFDEGSAPKVSLILTTDPTLPGWTNDPDDGQRPVGTATFLGLNSDGSLLGSSPQSGSPAPELIVIPELGEVLKNERWGKSAEVSIAANDNAGFVLSDCRR